MGRLSRDTQSHEPSKCLGQLMWLGQGIQRKGKGPILFSREAIVSIGIVAFYWNYSFQLQRSLFIIHQYFNSLCHCSVEYCGRNQNNQSDEREFVLDFFFF